MNKCGQIFNVHNSIFLSALHVLLHRGSDHLKPDPEIYIFFDISKECHLFPTAFAVYSLKNRIISLKNITKPQF